MCCGKNCIMGEGVNVVDQKQYLSASNILTNFHEKSY
jgi:hypothetical protein